MTIDNLNPGQRLASAFLDAQAEHSKLQASALGAMAEQCARQLVAKDIVIAELTEALRVAHRWMLDNCEPGNAALDTVGRAIHKIDKDAQ